MKLKDMKRNHLFMIMNDIYIHKSSTMNELTQRLMLSQPSVRNMVRLLQEHHAIVEIGNDSSSGGRCPIRFAINQNDYHILYLYVHDYMIYFQMKHFDLLIESDMYHYHNQNEMIVFVNDLLQKYTPHCCMIAVDGIVDNDEYITDHHNMTERQQWIKKLKETVKIPIYLINDIKAMHLGSYFHHQKKHTYYLHMNKVGIGSSYFYDNQPIFGASGLMGEIGLMAIDDQTLNQKVRGCQSQEEFNHLLCFILSMIYTMVDPYYIDLSIDLNWQYDQGYINQYFKNHYDLCFQGKLHYNKNFIELMFQGLEYIGIENLMKEITKRM